MNELGSVPYKKYFIMKRKCLRLETKVSSLEKKISVMLKTYMRE